VSLGQAILVAGLLDPEHKDAMVFPNTGNQDPTRQHCIPEDLNFGQIFI
jgi:hypothetical protein